LLLTYYVINVKTLLLQLLKKKLIWFSWSILLFVYVTWNKIASGLDPLLGLAIIDGRQSNVHGRSTFQCRHQRQRRRLVPSNQVSQSNQITFLTVRHTWKRNIQIYRYCCCQNRVYVHLFIFKYTAYRFLFTAGAAPEICDVIK
jgi:hypothetical protein